MLHLRCRNTGNFALDSFYNSGTQFALRINKSYEQCSPSGINFVICIWTDQCRPACFPCGAWPTSNPQCASRYHDEVDTVMTVPGGCEPWSPHNYCCLPDPRAGIWMHYHEPNYDNCGMPKRLWSTEP